MSAFGRARNASSQPLPPQPITRLDYHPPTLSSNGKNSPITMPPNMGTQPTLFHDLSTLGLNHQELPVLTKGLKLVPYTFLPWSIQPISTIQIIFRSHQEDPPQKPLPRPGELAPTPTPDHQGDKSPFTLDTLVHTNFTFDGWHFSQSHGITMGNTHATLPSAPLSPSQDLSWHTKNQHPCNPGSKPKPMQLCLKTIIHETKSMQPWLKTKIHAALPKPKSLQPCLKTKIHPALAQNQIWSWHPKPIFKTNIHLGDKPNKAVSTPN